MLSSGACYVMLCYVMSCHVMSCHILLCYVMLCYREYCGFLAYELCGLWFMEIPALWLPLWAGLSLGPPAHRFTSRHETHVFFQGRASAHHRAWLTVIQASGLSRYREPVRELMSARWKRNRAGLSKSHQWVGATVRTLKLTNTLRDWK